MRRLIACVLNYYSQKKKKRRHTVLCGDVRTYILTCYLLASKRALRPSMTSPEMLSSGLKNTPASRNRMAS